VNLPLHIRDISEPIHLVISKTDEESFPVATLTVHSHTQSYTFHLHNPRPLSSLVALFEECYNLVLIDRNAEPNDYLEFGRYRMEIWDEERTIADLLVDSVEVTTIDISTA
jgi:hypothetical protein